MIISKINECPPFGFGKYISDHISFSFSLPFQANLKINQKVGLNFRKSNLYSIHQSLSSIDWNLLLSNSTDINNMFNIFYNTLYNILMIMFQLINISKIKKRIQNIFYV